MNIFANHSYAWWHIGLLKLAVLFVGIAIGANWPEVFVGHTVALVVVGVILGLYLKYVWFNSK